MRTSKSHGTASGRTPRRPIGAPRVAIALLSGCLALLPACTSGGDDGGGGGTAPSQASSPAPADAASDVPTGLAALSWAGDGDFYSVLFGTSNPPGQALPDTDPSDTTVAAPALQAGTTYYWSVASTNAVGTTAGAVWSFTTATTGGPGLPGVATNPMPADGATDQPTDATLSWTAGADTDSFDVYFGTSTPLGAGDLQGNQTATTFDPGALAGGATYYWRVDAQNAQGTTAGSEWSFATVLVTCVDESEPNDDAASADALTLQTPGCGAISPGTDRDTWAVMLTGGSVIEVVLRARAADETWAGGTNQPVLTLWDTDGVTQLLQHRPTNQRGFDQDMPRFLVPTSGQYYLSIEAKNSIEPSGSYFLWVNPLDLGPLQQEAESATNPTTTGLNDTPASAELLQPGSGADGLVHGFHVDGESDFFALDLPASPVVVQAELHAWRNGVSRGDDDYFNPELRLVAADGTTTLQTDDDTYYLDPTLNLALQPAAATTVYVEVRECCGTGDGEYFLTWRVVSRAGAVTESEPNDSAASATPAGAVSEGAFRGGDPEDWWSFSGEAGQMVAVGLYDVFNSDPNTTGFSQFVTVELWDLTLPGSPVLVPAFSQFGGPYRILRTILTATTTYGVRVVPSSPTPNTGYSLSFSVEKAAGFETEAAGTDSNNDTANAEPFPGPGGVAGVLDHDNVGSGGDLDFFSFSAQAGEVVSFAIYTGRENTYVNWSPLDDFGSALTGGIAIWDGGPGRLLLVKPKTSGITVLHTAQNWTDGQPAQTITFRATAGGTYFLEVLDGTETDQGSASHFYLVERR